MSGHSFLGDKNGEDELIRALAQELSTPGAELAPDAAKSEAEVVNALSSVIATLTKCAEKLEEVGHVSSEQIDNVLAFIEKEFFTAPTAK